MNYEQKYKEALGRAKDLHDNHALGMPFVYQTCEDIFPELKESEDERVRKSLIEHIKGITSWNYFLGISKEQMIAWLEKQKFNNYDQGCKEGVEQGRIWEKASQELEKQKPVEWSEEDKKKIDFLVHLIERNVAKGDYSFGDCAKYGMVSKEEAIDMLKSLKPQPKQEWNEEDNEMVEYIIAAIKIGDYYTQDEINKMTSWLKSLKPNHWKPNEEQIKSLRVALQTMPYSKDKENVLVILEELEKL